MKFTRPKRLNPNTVVLLKQILSGVAAIVAVALVITLVWYFARLESFTIASIVVVGGETINLQEVEAVAWQQLTGTYLGLIPRTFVWMYPATDIFAALQGFERIHNVVISRPERTQLLINFDEYLPRALWCAEVASDDCVFVDETGFAYTKAPGLTGGSFLRFVRIGEGYTLDEWVLSTDEFLQLLKTVELLEVQGWYISQVEVDTAGDAFLRVVDGGEFKITLGQTPEQTVENLLTILTAKEFEHIKPGNFQYVDLRYGNKVFVNEEEKIATSSVEVASSTVEEVSE